jgi:hypothetical protein
MLAARTCRYDEIQAAKNQRLANLLGFAAMPSRALLLHELLNEHRILDQVTADVKAVYQLLEVDVAPLDLTASLNPVLSRIATTHPSLAPYAPALQRAVVLLLLRQLAAVYQVLCGTALNFLLCWPLKTLSIHTHTHLVQCGSVCLSVCVVRIGMGWALNMMK